MATKTGNALSPGRRFVPRVAQLADGGCRSSPDFDPCLSSDSRRSGQRLDYADRDLRRGDPLAQAPLRPDFARRVPAPNARGANDRPAVSITFDDGYAENCQTALPLLIAERIPCTYFVCTQPILQGTPFAHDQVAGKCLPPNSVEQLRALVQAGIEIGAHSRTHLDFGQHPDRCHAPRRVSDGSRRTGRSRRTADPLLCISLRRTEESDRGGVSTRSIRRFCRNSFSVWRLQFAGRRCISFAAS